MTLMRKYFHEHLDSILHKEALKEAAIVAIIQLSHAANSHQISI